MEPYGVGIDIGTSSIGWTVINVHGRVIRVRHHLGIGVRLFREGESAGFGALPGPPVAG